MIADENFQSGGHQSGRNSQQLGSEGKPMESLTGGLASMQKCLKFVIILLILLMSYMLYDNYLGHRHTDYKLDNSPQFAGDQYYRNLSRVESSDFGAGQASDGGEYITFGNPGSQGGKKPKNVGKGNKTKPRGTKGNYSGSKGSNDQQKNLGSKIWCWITYPFKKVRDGANYVADLVRGKPDSSNKKTNKKNPKSKSGKGKSRKPKSKDPYADTLEGLSESSEPGTMKDFNSNKDRLDKTPSNDSEVPVGDETSALIGEIENFDLENENPMENPSQNQKTKPKRQRDNQKRNQNQWNEDKNPSAPDYNWDSIDQRYPNNDSRREEPSKNMKFSVPKSDIRLPSMKDIRSNPKKYGVKTRVDPSIINEPLDLGFPDDDKENQEMLDLFGDENDPKNELNNDSLSLSPDDLGLGDVDGLKLLLDPNFLNKVKSMIRDLMGSTNNLKRNKDLLKKFKREIQKNQAFRNKCKDKVSFSF